MKFDVEIPTCREGIFVPSGFAGAQEVVESVVKAERWGYHAVWATDFITPTPSLQVPDAAPPSWHEPMVTLAYAAARTERIKLGTGVLILPYRDPVILAKQAAALDQLSGGRFLLGLGLGAFRDEFLALNPRQGKAHRGRIADEYLEVLMRCLNDSEPVTFAGEYIQTRGVALHPKPLQQPLPIYMPVRNESTLERGARLGLHCMFGGNTVAEWLPVVEAAFEKHGRAVADVSLIAEGELCLARTHEAAARAYRESRMGQYRGRKADLDSIIAAHWIGTAEEVVEKIARIEEHGIEHCNVLHIAGDTLEERWAQMQMFAEEVMSKLR